MGQKKNKKVVSDIQQKTRLSVLPVYKPNIWLAVISALTGFCLYMNTIHHDYVLDDVGAITGNEYVTEGIKGIPKILSVGMWHFDNVNLGYYRPLSMITFAIENQLFPNNPHVSHLGNVILYAFTGFFVCLLLMNMFRNFHPVFAFIITLLFLAHPIHTEVVANIKSRDEILAFLNLVIGIFILLKSYTERLGQTTNYKLVFLSCIFFYLALLSKETAMTGLLIAPLILYFACSITIRQSLLRTIPFLLMIIIFQIHKYEVIGTVTGIIPKDIVNYPYTEAGAKIPSAFLIFLHCIRLIIFPHPLSYDYSYNQIPAEGFGSAKVLAGFFLAVALICFCFNGFLKKSTLAFGAIFFCITLAPAMAFVFLRGGILAERFLYAPSLGFCIAMVWLLGPIPFHSLRKGFILNEHEFAKFLVVSNMLRPRLVGAGMYKGWSCKPIQYRYRMGLLFFLFLSYSFKTITRNYVWHDNMTLFSTDVNVSPKSCQVRRHYGSELINLGISEKDPEKKTEWFNKGIAQLREAIRINPHFGDAFFKMGVAYQTVKANNDSAIFYYNRAIQEAPGYAISYNNLGILYEGLGKQEMASYYYNKAVEVNPYFQDGVKNRDAHRKKTGLDVRMFPAANNLDSLLKATPEEKQDYNFYYKLGTGYASKGDYVNAIRLLEKSINKNPAFVDAMVNLSNCYGILKNYDKNIEILNKVLALSPNNVQALGNLAVTYELLGDKEKSEEYKDKVKALGSRPVYNSVQGR